MVSVAQIAADSAENYQSTETGQKIGGPLMSQHSPGDPQTSMWN